MEKERYEIIEMNYNKLNNNNTHEINIIIMVILNIYNFGYFYCINNVYISNVTSDSIFTVLCDDTHISIHHFFSFVVFGNTFGNKQYFFPLSAIERLFYGTFINR